MSLTRLVLFFEQLGPALWPLLGVCGLFLALALLDLLPALPGWLHAAVLVAFLAALIWAVVRGVRGLAVPDPGAAQRRLEQDSGLDHRPLATLDDNLATGVRNRATQMLWREHKYRILRRLGHFRVRPPRPRMAAADPWALRAALGLLLLVAVVSAGANWADRLTSAVTPRLIAPQAVASAGLDVWLNPPAYTGLPPLFLGASDGTTAPLEVPHGSTLLAQVSGGSAVPRLRVGEAVQDMEPVATGAYRGSAVIEAGTRIAVEQGGAELGVWPITVVPDQAPTVEFISPPGHTERSVLRLEYGAEDDYGLSRVLAEIRRIDAPNLDPIVLDLPLPGLAVRQAENGSYHDLTPHPWAGIAVEIQLVARDAIDQEGRSDPVRTVLPERIFNHPVARALVELRKQLTLEPENRLPVIRALSDLYQHPAHFFHDFVVALAIRSAERRLIHDRKPEAVGEVQELMWDTALRIEDGDLSIAERNLRQIQEALMRALAEGASDEEIERLMEELRAALDRYLRALAEQMQEQLAQGMEPQPLPPDSQFLESRDLEELLNRARELARTGARDAARELLSQLQDLLENLRANAFSQMMDQDSQNAWQMMRDMNDIRQQQQELLDRSYRRSQQGGDQNRGKGEENQNQRDATNQDALRRKLGELMRRLGDALGEIPGPMGRAEQAMRDARDALQRDQPGQAVPPQTRALDQLQQGLEAMAQSFMQQMGRSPGQGQGTVGMQPGQGRDPLGRDMGDFGVEALEGVEIPDKMELRRAREILDELRRRRGQRHRPPLELDYLDRLLQQF